MIRNFPYIVLAITYLAVGLLITYGLTRVNICQQAYSAKVSQQIPTCKEWEDNIDKMKVGN